MVSQPFFVRSILFPKIEEALGARLEADIIEFGPFSSLVPQGRAAIQRWGNFGSNSGHPDRI